MQWGDVTGPPGVGKSTVCDPLWGPHAIDFQNAEPPAQWHDFFNEVTRLLMVIRDHPSFIPAVRMNRRSMRKMAAVDASAGYGFYVQTGFVQRGLGFGWRLLDMGLPIEETHHFWRLMPVSLGVCFLDAPVDVIKQRNKDREKVKATAHENRTHMVDNMRIAASYARTTLEYYQVPIKEIETTGDPDNTRDQLLDHFGPLNNALSETARCDRENRVFPPNLQRAAWW